MKKKKQYSIIFSQVVLLFMYRKLHTYQNCNQAPKDSVQRIISNISLDFSIKRL